MRSSKRVTLEEYVKNLCKEGRGRCTEVLKRIYRDSLSGKVELVDLHPPKDFLEYLSRPEYSLWLWTILVLTALTLLSIVLTPVIPHIKYLRYVLGTIVVMFLPGYTTIEALYPRERELTPLERLALSIGLSLAIVPLLGLLLNYTPWGIKLESILLSLTLYLVLVAITASYRKYQKMR